jgi:tellurite resistance protein TehA-like permease
MTTPQSGPENAPENDRWLRAIGYGLLAEIATIFTIIAIVLVYRYLIARSLSDEDYVSFAQRVGAIVGVIGGSLYVFLYARRLMRFLSARFVAHGVVVAIAAIALSIGGSIAGHQGVPSAYLPASALKLLAGALAGWLASRRAHRTS